MLTHMVLIGPPLSSSFSLSNANACTFSFSHRSLGRLKDLVAEHLDHLHYLNDILCLQIEALNAVLTDHLLNRLFIPLYIYSMLGSRSAAMGTQQTKLEVREEDHTNMQKHIFFTCVHSNPGLACLSAQVLLVV